MSEHKCNSCFYMQHERNRHPCNECKNYSKYVNRNIYIQKPDTVTISTWDDSLMDDEVFDGYYGGSEDYVEKANDVINAPKHYMLFEKEGIEVRQVIAKLVEKIQKAQEYAPLDVPLFEADYVQMMQYLMRFMDKNGVEDLKKAQWYLNKLIEAYE